MIELIATYIGSDVSRYINGEKYNISIYVYSHIYVYVHDGINNAQRIYSSWKQLIRDWKILDIISCIDEDKLPTYILNKIFVYIRKHKLNNIS